ncbi:MAG: NYN domain-containing protein [Clostridia bacterium]|nr:NYN domain-containing protein [Clostridia bacterium]
MQKPKAVAFIDFEHWYISLDRFYHTRPDMKAWFAEVSKTYDVRDVYVFADFSNQSLRAEIPKIREITSSIIETQNASAFVTKDFTDFIMLDHIYQKALSEKEIKAFIIFSGDGHFSSVTSFLRNRCSKTVGIYGVRGALSSQLRNTATWCVEIPATEKTVDENQKYYDMIFGNLKYLAENNRGERKMYPTFRGTVDAVSAYYSANRDDVMNAMRYLVERDYIVQSEEKVDAHHTVKVIKVNWDLAIREGIYTPVEKETENKTATDAKKSAQKPSKKDESKKSSVKNDQQKHQKAPAQGNAKQGSTKNKGSEKKAADVAVKTQDTVIAEPAVKDEIKKTEDSQEKKPSQNRKRRRRRSNKKTSAPAEKSDKGASENG